MTRKQALLPVIGLTILVTSLACTTWYLNGGFSTGECTSGDIIVGAITATAETTLPTGSANLMRLREEIDAELQRLGEPSDTDAQNKPKSSEGVAFSSRHLQVLRRAQWRGRDELPSVRSVDELSPAARRFYDKIHKLLGDYNHEPDWKAIKRQGSSDTMFYYRFVQVFRALRHAHFGDLSQGYASVAADVDGYQKPPVTERGEVRAPSSYTPAEKAKANSVWKHVALEHVLVQVNGSPGSRSNIMGKHKCALPDAREMVCEFTTTPNRTADGKLYFSLRGMPPTLTSNPWRVAARDRESEANYPIITRIRQRFAAFTKELGDTARHPLVMDYRIDSDVPTTYGFFNSEFEPLPLEQRQKIALYLQSNCVQHRDKYVRELMKHYTVHAGGHCLKNHDIKVGKHHYTENTNVYAAYKFAICFENSISDYYVTERVYHALESGAVPVYLGAPNAELVLPPNSVIFAADFPSPEALGKYMRLLDENDDLYLEYGQWRKQGSGGMAPGSNFNRLLSAHRQDSKIDNGSYQCRMCYKLLHKCDRSCSCGGKLVDERAYYDGAPWDYSAALPLIQLHFPG